MLDKQLLRTNLDSVVARLAERGYPFPVARYQAIEEERKVVQTRTQEIQAKKSLMSH